jgi:outer membrane protein TolC
MFLEKLITTAKENYHRINSFEGRIKDSETKEKVKLAQYELDEYQLTLETEVKKRYFSYIRALTNLRLQTKITSEALNISHNIKTRF